jgi:hypothetical protein
MKQLRDLLKKQQEIFDDHKYISTEFQDFGYRLALKLDDLEHKSLYIKLAKEVPRSLLEQALSFAADYPNVRKKGKVFMWKLKELRNGQPPKTD